MSTSSAIATARNWLTGCGATHVTYSTLRNPKGKRLTVDYALAKARTLSPSSATVNTKHASCTLIGWNRIIAQHDALAVLSEPMIRRQIGVLPDGRPEYEFEAVSDD